MKANDLTPSYSDNDITELFQTLLGINHEKSTILPSPRTLAKMSKEELCLFLTPKQAAKLQAAFKLGILAVNEPIERGSSFISPSQIVRTFRPRLSLCDQEEMWIVLLDATNRIIKEVQVAIGTVKNVQVDSRSVFREAITNNASSIILVHNHPSGQCQPSEGDKRVTQVVKQAGDLLDIKLLDHVIITSNSYYSFVSQGLL